MDAAKLNETIAGLKAASDGLKAASDALRKHCDGLAGTVRELPCDGEALLGLLAELADAETDCSEHFSRFEDQRGVDYDAQSKECRDDWSRCHDRRMKAVSRVTRFALVLRKGSTEAA